MSETLNLSDALTDAQQAAVVGHCFLDEEFLLKCKNHVRPEWFTGDLMVAHIYAQLIKFYEDYKMTPASTDELLAEPFFKSQNKFDFQKYSNKLLICISHAGGHNLDVLRPRLATFIKMMKFREAQKAVNQNINKHNYDTAAEISGKAIKVYNEVSFDKETAVSFADTISLWRHRDEGLENAISTGSKALDDLLNGGLVRGENMAVLAPTFTGKSRFLITMLRHLLVQDYKVLYITHEDNPDKIKKRIIGSICGIGQAELDLYMKKEGINVPRYPLGRMPKKAEDRFNLPNWSIDEGRQLYEVVLNELERARELLTKNLTFVHWVKAGHMDVENVIEEIRRLNLQEKAKTGKGFDVLINDYPARLQSKRKYEHDRSKLANIYNEFNILADELKLHCIYAVQVNRGAAKLMKSGEATSAIGLEDVGEAYGISQNAISAISLSRNPDDVKADCLRISVVKARDGEPNKMVFTRAAYNECILYGDASMFTKYGQFMAKGLANIVTFQSAQDTGTLKTGIETVEGNTSPQMAETLSKLPLIVKKIKEFPGGT